MNDVIKLFEQGLSIFEILDYVPKDLGTVRKILKDAGYWYYHNDPAKSKLLIVAAQQYINSDISLTSLAKKYQLDIYNLSNTVKLLGGKVVNKHNLPKFNEHIFDCIDTEEKAYWLGFIFADGYISAHKPGKKSRYTFELGLGLKDVDHLHKFNKFMGYNGNNVKTDNHRCRWSVGNKHLWTTLNALGCIPRKSLFLEFPKLSQFVDAFVRGYLDGDGTLGVYTTKYNPKIYCQCIGTKAFLSKIIEIYDIKAALGHDIRTSEQVYHFQLSGLQCYNFVYKLYNNATVYLDRKFQKYKEICRLWEESHKSLSSKNDGV